LWPRAPFSRLSALPKVSITEGPGAGKEYEIEQAAILGRLDSNDIPVHDTKASREHAKIYKQGSQYAIVDLNSSNGTFVNGDKITKRMLKPGDVIGIGLVRLTFEFPEEALVQQGPARKSLEEAFEAAKTEKEKPAAAPASGASPDIVLRGHKPIQYQRIKPGQPLIGFDLDQLSEGGRLIVYIVLLAIFAGLMYLGYAIVT